ncbi:Saccharopine dehydrogenase-domain-containing protein [Biscogniauxia mediterranea]|nr:Saccharopine dehydrogenase-domain-containing protein [Biscogniauxia mediterranea]
MTQPGGSREYGILLLGATGYTGTLTANHIARYLPRDLKWALGGRSKARLDNLATNLKIQFPERVPPDVVEIVSFDNRGALASAVRRAQVCISIISYTAVGEAVIQACVQNGTDYVDAAAIPPLLHTWVKKYHQSASDAGVVLVHACGASVAPMDILVQAAVRKIETGWSMKTKEITLSIDHSSMKLSAGTVETMLHLATMKRSRLREAESPEALSPVKVPTGSHSPKMSQHPILGLLSPSSFLAEQNRTLINRTWGLLHGTETEYGPNFQYHEYQKATSKMAGKGLVLQKHALNTMLGLVRLAPMRYILQRVSPGPGTGPDDDGASVVIDAIATADTTSTQQIPSLHVHLSYPHGVYQLTALCLAQGAASLLYDRKLVGNWRGGCLTPALLGSDILERIQRAGVVIKITPVASKP